MSSETRWRVGRHQPHNIYHDDVHVAVALGDAAEAAQVAARICEVMNRVDSQ